MNDRNEIYVATKNPGKLEGVSKAFGRNVRSQPAESDVSGQPSSFDEIIEGARQRAKNVRAVVEDENAYYVGIESGYHEYDGHKIQITIAAIIHREAEAIGIGQSYTLPFELAKRMPRLELRDAEREAYGHDTGQAGGIISVLSAGEVSRPELVRQATQMALMSLDGDESIRAYMEER